MEVLLGLNVLKAIDTDNIKEYIAEKKQNMLNHGSFILVFARKVLYQIQFMTMKSCGTLAENIFCGFKT